MVLGWLFKEWFQSRCMMMIVLVVSLLQGLVIVVASAIVIVVIIPTLLLLFHFLLLSQLVTVPVASGIGVAHFVIVGTIAIGRG